MARLFDGTSGRPAGATTTAAVARPVHGVYGLVVGERCCGARRWPIASASPFPTSCLGLFSGGLFFVGMLVGALRRIDPPTIGTLSIRARAPRTVVGAGFMGVGSIAAFMQSRAACTEAGHRRRRAGRRNVETRRRAVCPGCSTWPVHPLRCCRCFAVDSPAAPECDPAYRRGCAALEACSSTRSSLRKDELAACSLMPAAMRKLPSRELQSS